MVAILLRSTLRLLARNKVLSVIKVMGLAVGSAIFLITARYSLEEFSYDKQHPDYDQIYRYVHRVNTPEGMQSFAFTAAMTGPALKERFPEVIDFTRVIVPVLSVMNDNADVAFNERRFAFVDSNFLTRFHFPLQAGSSDLSDPLSVILTPSMARKYFADMDPVGKTLVINGELQFVVKGIFSEDFRNSHFNFEFVAPYSALEVISNIPAVARQIPVTLNLERKGFNAFYTYLMLAPGSKAALEGKFPEFIEEFRGKGRSERLKPTLQPMQSIHLGSALLYEIDQNGSTTIVYVYFFVGLMVLVIACINYVNISTAEILTRTRGIGLKKILGVTRSSLFMNCMGETSLLVLISMLLGLTLVVSISTAFNTLVSRHIEFVDTLGLLLFASIFVVMVLLSGIYPAAVITRSKGLDSLRGSYHASQGSFFLRNALVFFQLVVSFCLITVSSLIYYQLDYMISRDPGFDADQVMTINATSATHQDRRALKSDLLSKAGVLAVGLCSVPPGGSLFSVGLTMPQNKSDEDRRVLFYQSYVDADYLKAIGVSLDSGRFFDPGSAADSTHHIVVNRSGVEVIGDEVLAAPLDVPDLHAGGTTKKTVVGIINDFNFASLHQAIEPLALEYNPNRCNYLLVRFTTSEASAVVRTVEASWKEHIPSVPFDYSFLNEQFASFYEDEERQRDVVAGLALVAIVLASLGIFGTTLFVAQRRSREMGIRKVLGCDRREILLLLVRPLLMLVTTACVVGVPLSLFYGNSWLEAYPFRIEYSPWILFSGFGATTVIVLATALYHFLAVTRVNPVDVIRASD